VEKMKVCILGHFPPHIGGVSSHTYLLAKELIKRGDEVYVLTYPHPEIHDIGGIHVESAPTVNIKGLRGLFFFLTATFKMISLTKKYNLDVVHAHFLMPPGLIAVIASIITKKKTAVTVHGSDIFIQASKPILRTFIKFVLKRADYVAVVNETIKEKVLDLNIKGMEDKIFLTPNAVDTEKYNPQVETDFIQEMGLSSGKPSVLFVGNLVFQKGLEYLLEAKKLSKSNYELVIVGDGPLMGELQEMAKNQNIEDITFVGARRDVQRIMPACDVFVLPSISEGFPITILEAFASGIPVVATSVGGIPGVVTEEVGIVVEPKNSIALAEAIEHILQDDSLRDKMGKAARKEALKYASIEIPY
jgi:L-malate glycosyltransferase